MKKFAANMLAVDQGVVGLISDFDTGGDMWSGEGPRERRVDVTFAEPFRSMPTVHLSLQMFDMDHKHNQRFDLDADQITEEGFSIVFRTWSDTRIARARASWMAIGSARYSDDWDVD